MQETRWDGSERLTDAVTAEQVQTAVDQLAPRPSAGPARRNRSVALHAPGSEVKLGDGSCYRVGPKGNWIRLDKKLSKKARQRNV